MRRTTSETYFNKYRTPKNVVDFALVEDGLVTVPQNSIYVAMTGSAVATFSAPIANVPGRVFLAWANKCLQQILTLSLTAMLTRKMISILTEKN